MPSESKIPRIIHYCWLSDDPVPDEMQRYMKSWKILKGYEFIKWDRKRFDLEAHIWAKEAFEAKKYAFAADEVRLYALYHYGGIYLDMDVEVIKTFDKLLDNNLMLATEFDDFGIEAGCMGAREHDPFIKSCLDYYKDRPFTEGTVLPVVMRRVMEESHPHLIKNLKTKEYFTAKDYFTGMVNKTSKTYAVHNYSGSWKDKSSSDKLLVARRWRFFQENGDSKLNTDVYKELEMYRSSHIELAEVKSRLNIVSNELSQTNDHLIYNMKTVAIFRALIGRILKRATGERLYRALSHKVTGSNRGKQTIHFISRFDDTNVGDIAASPLNVYGDYFYKRYLVVKHDIYSVNIDGIRKEDVVIIGGGGLLDCLEEWQDTINRVLDKCEHVIGWGLGTNTHYSTHSKLKKIRFSRFSLLATRDFANKESLEYCPCVSALLLTKIDKHEASKGIGVVTHGSIPISSSVFRRYDTVDNSVDLATLIDFILSHKVIVTNSYHAAYWAQLLERKVIVAEPTSTKFEFLKYKPVFYSGDLASDITNATICGGALADAVEANTLYFKKVRDYLRSVK